MEKECDTIITDRAIGLIRAIKKLNQQYFTKKVTHIFDIFYQIKKLKISNKKTLKVINLVIKSTTFTEF